MDPTDGQRDIEIQLDIFSGRPNPTWTVAGETADRLWSLLRDLEPAPPQEPPDLGYRGFLLVAPPQTVRAYNGTLAFLPTREERPTYYRDSGGIEETLLDQARELGYGQVIDAFRQAPSP
jgi:hypothetical protein